MLRIFFIGDVVGRPGRRFVIERLHALRVERGIDLVIANGENAAGGSGITGAVARDLLGAGIDGITLGDHVWDQRGWTEEIGDFEQVCKPANLPAATPGRAWIRCETRSGTAIAVFTVLGRQFMKGEIDSAFHTSERLLEEIRGAGIDHVLVEVHAEATSEKVALGRFLDGRVIGVLGTHTHIPTADLSVLPGGSAYQTDVGMSGPYDSVLGRDVESVVERFRDGLPRRFPVAEHDVRICGAILDYDPDARTVVAAERLEERRGDPA